jgi:hypothetical protein
MQGSRRVLGRFISFRRRGDDLWQFAIEGDAISADSGPPRPTITRRQGANPFADETANAFAEMANKNQLAALAHMAILAAS